MLTTSSPEVVALPILDTDAIHSTGPDDCLVEVHDVTESMQGRFKPDGLWYGLGRSWFDWTAAEHFSEQIGHVYRLHLDRSGMLLLRTVDDLDRFSRDYCHGDSWDVDWRAVARGYTGIEIAPYQWERRMQLTWYYPWDVASGCIWQASAVKRVELLL